MRKNLPFNDQFNANAIALKKERNKRALISRVIIVILILILKIGISYSQISYTSARTTGITYTSISSTGTSFAGWRNGTSTDDNLSNSTPIGFNFYYDGAYRTTFSVSTNGFITFNTGTTEIGSGTGAYGYSNTAFSASTATSAQSVAPMYDDLQTKNNPVTAASLASSIKYKLSGTVPNRVLTIEWIAMEYYGSAGENINLQIKLNETTNIIEFWYGTMSPGSATYTYTSGLNSLTISSTPLVTELYTQQTANTATFSNIASNSLATIPAANTKIVFTPPAVCSGTPVAGTATATTSSFCASGSTTVTLTGYSSGVAGISFQWQNSTDGGTTWNNISGATSSTYTTPTLTSTTKYLCVVKCNSSGLTANSSIATININTAPVISCPSNISANTAAGTCGAVVTYAATATGSPAPAITYSVNSGSTFNLGTTTVTATATNSCGTSACSFTVTVTDNINPSITAPATISVNTNSGCAATGVALGTPVTADNCTVASVTNNAPSTFPLGNTTVTWTVTDGSGHTATAAQTVTVTDNINPTITAPANVSVNTNSGCAATGVV
ncbi:MAG: HYR domain-containing protein, partial [Bacteroidia bacterium]